jgi:hypothetical protein
MKKNISIFALAIFSLSACKKSSSSDTDTPSGGNTVAVPAVYQKVYGASSITNDGTYISIKTNGMPDHKSVYYAPNNALYENFSGTTFGGVTFSKNPNPISSFNYTFKIPVNPQVPAVHSQTPLGPIGVAINGVPLFNQYGGPNQPLTNEITGFDQYWGHPQQQGGYHYHVEPKYLTQVKFNRSYLVGFLLDGFPVYGPEENGAAVNEATLDAYHGHSHATADYPNGIYHYHTTATAPYINGNGFYGTAGTVTQ